MKYKDAFKSWTLYITILAYFLFQIQKNIKIYGELYLSEYSGILIGSFLVVVFVYSVGYLIIKIFSKISKKVTKR